MMNCTAIDSGNSATKEALLLRAVDEMRSYVFDHMRGRPEEVDGVLQRIREIVWRRRESFDPARGRPADYVFGITRKVVIKELCRRRPMSQALSDEIVSLNTPDPLSALVARFDSHRWMNYVADEVGARAWQIVTSLALNENSEGSQAEAFGLSERALRATRQQVALVASTVRSAIDEADQGQLATLTVAAACIPDAAGLRAVLPYLDDRSEDTAHKLHIHPGTVRSRVATAKRLLNVAVLVLQREGA